MRASLALFLAALLLGFVGCGSSDEGDAGAGTDEDRERIETLAERFERIVAAEDAAAFCGELAPNDVQKLGGPGGGGKRCLAVWGKGRNPLFTAEDPDLSVEEIAFEGTYATAELANGGELGFVREGGRWYVHLAPGPGKGGKR
ncbi:MAG: hypothetical protein WDZ46_03330 [Solirubrobacterales bacterium]